LTPQGEEKGLDTIGKRAQLKFRGKRAPPEKMHFSQFFLSLMQNSPLET
jgi:hypothetical protein